MRRSDGKILDLSPGYWLGILWMGKATINSCFFFNPKSPSVNTWRFVSFLNELNAPSNCPDNIVFIQDKIKIVLDEIILFQDKIKIVMDKMDSSRKFFLSKFKKSFSIQFISNDELLMLGQNILSKKILNLFWTKIILSGEKDRAFN